MPPLVSYIYDSSNSVAFRFYPKSSDMGRIP